MISRTRAEDVMFVLLALFSSRGSNMGRINRYQMFEINMDEYLDEEVEYLKLTFDAICREWNKKVFTNGRLFLESVSPNRHLLLP